MLVHFIWLGGEIPQKYIPNIKLCQQLNVHYQVICWLDRDIEVLFDKYGVSELASEITFISKCNLAKYVVLAEYGGIISDLDIKWKKSFTQIMLDNNFPTVDLVLTYPAVKEFYLNGKEVLLFDDPFIISKPVIFKSCIDFRLKRPNLRIDVETGKIHKVEPIGPFLLSEWIYTENIKLSYFSQVGYLDGNGYYGNHEQFGLWKNHN